MENELRSSVQDLLGRVSFPDEFTRLRDTAALTLYLSPASFPSVSTMIRNEALLYMGAAADAGLSIILALKDSWRPEEGYTNGVAPLEKAAQDMKVAARAPSGVKSSQIGSFVNKIEKFETGIKSSVRAGASGKTGMDASTYIDEQYILFTDNLVKGVASCWGLVGASTSYLSFLPTDLSNRIMEAAGDMIGELAEYLSEGGGRGEQYSVLALTSTIKAVVKATDSEVEVDVPDSHAEAIQTLAILLKEVDKSFGTIDSDFFRGVLSSSLTSSVQSKEKAREMSKRLMRFLVFVTDDISDEVLRWVGPTSSQDPTVLGVLEGYSVTTSDDSNQVVLGIIDRLEDRGYDRAADSLRSGDIEVFATMTEEEASYAGAATESLRRISLFQNNNNDIDWVGKEELLSRTFRGGLPSLEE